MSFYLIGIDYKAGLSRAYMKAYKRWEDILGYWHMANPGNVSILRTCNRIEVYGTAENFYAARYFAGSFKRLFYDIFGNAYVLIGENDIYYHTLKLACGLKSQLRGECQIIHQIEDWLSDRDFPVNLHRFWKDIIETAKNIRRRAGLDDNRINIADIIFKDLKKKLTDRDTVRIMVIGTGKIAGLIAERKPAWAKIAFVARKKRIKAEKIAGLSGSEALLFEEMPRRLIDIDALVCATSSPHYVIKRSHFNEALKCRENPLYLYDLALLKDIAPGVSRIPFNVMIGCDKLAKEAFINDENYSAKIRNAERLAEEAAERYRIRYEDKDRHAAQPACHYASI